MHLYSWGDKLNFLSKISSKTIVFLNIFFTFLLILFICAAIFYIKAATSDPTLAEAIYTEVFENLYVSLALVIAGGAVFDCSIANGDLKK